MNINPNIWTADAPPCKHGRRAHYWEDTPVLGAAVCRSCNAVRFDGWKDGPGIGVLVVLYSTREAILHAEEGRAA